MSTRAGINASIKFREAYGESSIDSHAALEFTSRPESAKAMLNASATWSCRESRHLKKLRSLRFDSGKARNTIRLEITSNQLGSVSRIQMPRTGLAPSSYYYKLDRSDPACGVKPSDETLRLQIARTFRCLNSRVTATDRIVACFELGPSVASRSRQTMVREIVIGNYDLATHRLALTFIRMPRRFEFTNYRCYRIRQESGRFVHSTKCGSSIITYIRIRSSFTSIWRSDSGL